MYLINSGQQIYQFVQNTEMNDRCAAMRLDYDDLESDYYQDASLQISYEDESEFSITCTDSNQQGVHEMMRKDGMCQERFLISMCYLDEPS